MADEGDDGIGIGGVSGGIVDAHLHLWDPVRIAIGWLGEVPRLARPVLHDDFAVAARPLGIDAAVIVEAAVDETALDDELGWIHERIAARGLVAAGVAGWRPAGDRGRTAAWLDRLAEMPGIVGVREVLHPGDHDASAPSEAARMAACVEAGARGLVVDLCVRPDQLAAVERLATHAADTTFVLDHLGRPRAAEPLDVAWRAAIERLADRPNVHVKISALIQCSGPDAAWSAAGFAPFIDVVLDAFGPSRAMWGSNWPVCVDAPSALAAWFDAARLVVGDRGGAVRDEVFGGTARRVYGLAAD